MVIGTAGHIDHGKSALVLALTGTDPDCLAEEKARGITIDLGFAHAAIDGRDIAFVDVPGHERFVKNMLAGVGGLDAVLLVVAADESVMPQTREHFAICRLLGVTRGVIVLTKADLADAETMEIARIDVAELVAGTPLASADIVAVSAKTGDGLDTLRRAIAAVAAAPEPRAIDKPARLPVDRVFSMRGFGTVVTGTLTAGRLRVDQDVVLLPSGRRAKVRGLQVHGAPCADVDAGSRVAINLGGVDVAEVTRGDTVTIAGAFEPSTRLDVEIEILSDAKPLRHGARVRFHHGAAEIMGRVALAAGTPVLEPGARGIARIRLEHAAVVTRGDRFVLRAYSPSTTIAGGRILDPEPPRTGVRASGAAARFARLRGSDADAVMAMIDEQGATGLPLTALTARAGLGAAAAASVRGALIVSLAIEVGGALFATSLARRREEALVAAVTAHHVAQPTSDGLPREEARDRLGAGGPALFDAIVQRLIDRAALTGRERLSLPGRGISLTAEETRARDAIERAFREAGLAPPDASAIAAAESIDAKVGARMQQLLIRSKALIKVDALLFHASALERLKADVRAMKKAGRGEVNVAIFKDRFGLSRKYAIPLLEWLDRERVTRRAGDARMIL